MVSKKKAEPLPEGESVEDVDYSSHLESSLVKYGNADNNRMIPRVTDGLKVVQRRIIWGMYGMFGKNKEMRIKSTRIVGEVMGLYHPHGDASTYEAMVSTSQSEEDVSFRVNTPFVKGHGGWGSTDASASAPRYTEARMSEYSLLMLGSLDSIGDQPEFKEDAVPFAPTYDGSREEPIVLPSLYPAFAVNPYLGVGFGLQGAAPGHNFDEIMNLAHHMVDSPNPRYDTVRKYVSGPDLPRDCLIFDTDDGGIERYMMTGRGAFIMRAPMEVEEYKEGRKTYNRIIVTGLPFEDKATPEHVESGIKKMIDKEQLQPDIEVIDESASGVVRIIIDVKDNDPDDVVQRLLYYSGSSHLQAKFHVRMFGLSDENKPYVYSLPQAISAWISHRRHVVMRRTQFRLARLKERLHILEGYVRAAPLAEQIIQIVRAAKSREDAAQQVCDKWDFSAEQVEAILKLNIVQIARLGDDHDYNKQIDVLREKVERESSIIASESNLNSQVKREIRLVQKAVDLPRRCEVDDEHSAAVAAPDSPAVEYVPDNGYLARTSGNWVRWADRSNISLKVGNDYVTELLDVNDLFTLECFTNLGRLFRLNVGELPRKATLVDTLISNHLESGERVIWSGTLDYWEPEDAPDVCMMTASGSIKRLKHEDILKRKVNGKPFPAFKLDEDDEVAFAFPIEEVDDVLIVTQNGMISRIDSERLSPKGGGAAGNPGFKLDEDDMIVYAGPVTDESTIAYWLDDDTIGFAFGDNVIAKGRNTRGVSLIKLKDGYVRGAVSGYGDLVNWFSTEDDEEHAINFVEDRIKVGIGGRESSLKAVAEGIRTASDDDMTRCAVWISSSEDEVEEADD